MLSKILSEDLPLIVVVGQMQRTTLSDPKARLLGSLQPPGSGIHRNGLHRIGLTNHPNHSKVSDRCSTGSRRAIKDRHAMPSLCSDPSVSKTCDSSADDCNATEITCTDYSHGIPHWPR
jgi:hypothetical protein